MKSATSSPTSSTACFSFSEADALARTDDAAVEIESDKELAEDRIPSDGPAVADEAIDEGKLVAELYWLLAFLDNDEAINSPEPVDPRAIEEALDAAT